MATYRSTPSFALGFMPHGCDHRAWMGLGQPAASRCDQPATQHLDGEFLCEIHANAWLRGEEYAARDSEYQMLQGYSDL